MNNDSGGMGERAAQRLFIKKGYDIIDVNYRNYAGEIDIIAFKDGQTVFAEVKSRRSTGYGYPGETVNRKKRERYYKAALYYIAEKDIEMDMRFDVMEIFLDDRGKPCRINHIEDAFRPDGYR